MQEGLLHLADTRLSQAERIWFPWKEHPAILEGQPTGEEQTRRFQNRTRAPNHTVANQIPPADFSQAHPAVAVCYRYC